MLYAKPWEHPSAVVTLSVIILLSDWINSSTCCTVASFTFQQGDFWTSLREFLNPVLNHFTSQDTCHCKEKTCLYEYPLHRIFLPRKNTQHIHIFGSINLKHGRHFDYWNQPLNMCIQVCYVDYHEAGLCCHLVIHTGNLVHILQLFYFHLWPIYWFFLVSLFIFIYTTIIPKNIQVWCQDCLDGLVYFRFCSLLGLYGI
jgi:hypothetical protein